MLFKYLPAARVDVIQNLQIRFTQPSSLNDPFEVMQLVYDEKAAADFVLRTMERLDALWDGVDAADRTDDAKKLLDRTRIKTLRMLGKKLTPQTFGKVAMQEIDRSFGILSMSRVDDNLLMWSHYADAFRGFVIGLDDGHEFFRAMTPSGQLAKPRRVTYSSRRQILSPQDPEFQERLLCEKPLEWAYEQEERAFRYFLDDAPSVGEDFQGKPIYLVPIPPDAVSNIAIGCKASEGHRKTIVEVRDAFFPHAELHEAFPSDTHYEVVFKPLKMRRKK